MQLTAFIATHDEFRIIAILNPARNYSIITIYNNNVKYRNLFIGVYRAV